MLRATAVLLLSLAACNDTAIVGDPRPDGPGGGSGPGPVTATVMTVTCPADTTALPKFTAPPAADASGYTPVSVTVGVGGIVQFMMPGLHNVAPNPIRTSDSGLRVDFGATACLKFTQTGTFSFICSTHSFAGTVIVQ